MAMTSLSPVGTLRGSLTAIPTLLGVLSVGGAERDVPKYEGLDVYDITPKAYETQTFRTTGKMMDGDVVVHEVPFYSVSNTAGGNTIYIAREGRRG